MNCVTHTAIADAQGALVQVQETQLQKAYDEIPGSESKAWTS